MRTFLTAMAAGWLMVAATVPGATLGTAVFAVAAALAVPAAARWPGTPLGAVAVVLAGVALAAGHPSVPQGCAAGLLALVFLLAVEARRTADRTPTARWLATRAPLVVGGVVGAAAALLGGLVPGGGVVLAVAGTLAVGAVHLLAADSVTRKGKA